MFELSIQICVNLPAKFIPLSCLFHREMSRLSERQLLDRVKSVTFIPHNTQKQNSHTDLNLDKLQTDMDMDFNNELFGYLSQQTFAFPNPRELGMHK